MSFPAPFDRYRGEVLPEWIDLNGHLNLAYYTVLFDYATDLLFDELGLGRDYRETTQNGTFVAATHNLYERELLVGERVRVATQILAADDKRLHLAHEMFRLDGGERAATQELLYLHVSLVARRVSPFPPDLRARVDAAATAHAVLPRPDWVGHHIAMPAPR
jgi:acyl-CoA thioester hydrolase